MARELSLEKIQAREEGGVVVVEVPTDQYFQSNAASLKKLVKSGFEGVYVSFQRPFANANAQLEKSGVDTKKILFVDVATALGNQKREPQSRQCVHVSPKIDVDEIVHAIYTLLPKIKSKKKFVFVDSITTIALYKPLSETLRFSEYLIGTVRNHEAPGTLLLFNVASDLAQKKFIKDIALRADQTIPASRIAK